MSSKAKKRKAEYEQRKSKRQAEALRQAKIRNANGIDEMFLAMTGRKLK